MLVSSIQLCDSSISINIIYIIPFLSSLLTNPPHPTSLRLSRTPCVTHNFPLAFYFTHGSVCVSVLLFQFTPLSPSLLCVHQFIFCVCIYIPALFSLLHSVILIITCVKIIIYVLMF